MLVEYNNNVYNAEVIGDNVNIWKYVPVDGFKKAQTHRGTVYYENYVPKSEVGELFSVAFYTMKDEKKYIIKSLCGEKMTIICDDMEFANSNGFKEFEHGVWEKTVEKSFSNSFLMVKYIQNSEKAEEIAVSETELPIFWTKYVQELIL